MKYVHVCYPVLQKRTSWDIVVAHVFLLAADTYDRRYHSFPFLKRFPTAQTEMKFAAPPWSYKGSIACGGGKVYDQRPSRLEGGSEDKNERAMADKTVFGKSVSSLRASIIMKM